MKKWQPNTSAFPHKPGTNKLLWEAFQNLQPCHLVEKLKDNVGTFALNTDKGVLVAKKEVYGWCVSAHKRAVISALNQGKCLIMYVGRKFYGFDPQKILDNSEENTRGKAVMLNWNIKLGTRREVIE